MRRSHAATPQHCRVPCCAVRGSTTLHPYQPPAFTRAGDVQGGGRRSVESSGRKPGSVPPVCRVV
jgi:hypothetical protein